MNHLIAKGRVPYGGRYVLNCPEKGIIATGGNFDSVLRSATEWRKANSIPIGLGFEDELEQVICEKYPQECKDHVLTKPRKTKLGLSTVLRGTQVLLSFKVAGSPYVEPAEAERRAAICSKCTWNQEYAKPCGGNCGGLKEMVSKIIGHQKTSCDSQLKSCGICGCVAQAHVWLPLEYLAKGVNDEMRQQFATVENCWKQNV